VAPESAAVEEVETTMGSKVERELQIRKLFVSVRADCAVFYSTPHPPHF
jgi:hypothetical protein